jgi:predicted amidohydrolase
VRPDRAGVETGVPTVVDGGTSGVATFGLATTGPATSIRRDCSLGTLPAGRKADISVLRTVDGPAQLSDSHETITAERLVPVGCVRAGQWHAAVPASPTSSPMPDPVPDPSEPITSPPPPER